MVPTEQIVSAVAEGELLHLTTVRNEKHVICYRLKDLEARLDPARFVRLSRGTLANTRMIARFSPMPGGTYLAIMTNGAGAGREPLPGPHPARDAPASLTGGPVRRPIRPLTPSGRPLIGIARAAVEPRWVRSPGEVSMLRHGRFPAAVGRIALGVALLLALSGVLLRRRWK